MPHCLATRTFLTMALATVIAVVLPSPVRADYCEITGCRTECRPVPGGRWCRNVCRRRCWRSAPRYDPPPYVPEPRYDPPAYAPVSTAGPDPLPALLVLGGIGIIVVLVIAAVASGHSASDELVNEAAETERQTADTKALVTKLEEAAREADAHLNRFLADTQHPPR
jgi:hypothetical protein